MKTHRCFLFLISCIFAGGGKRTIMEFTGGDCHIQIASKPRDSSTSQNSALKAAGLTPCLTPTSRRTIARKFDKSKEEAHAAMRDSHLEASNRREEDSGGVRRYFVSPKQHRPTLSMTNPSPQRYVISPTWPIPPCHVNSVVRPIIAVNRK